MKKLRMIRNILLGWPVAYRVSLESGQLVVKQHGVVADCMFISTGPKRSLWAAFRRKAMLFLVQRGWTR